MKAYQVWDDRLCPYPTSLGLFSRDIAVQVYFHIKDEFPECDIGPGIEANENVITNFSDALLSVEANRDLSMRNHEEGVMHMAKDPIYWDEYVARCKAGLISSGGWRPT
jgi:hypothetical protein